jgi:transposase-like protein
VLAVRWYLRYSLSYRDVEELLAERGLAVDHVTVYRWVQHFTPLLAEAARPCRHGVGDRWWVDETYVKVSGQWRYVYRAIAQFVQVIDVYLSPRRDTAAARCFFTRALNTTKVTPVEVITDKATVYPRVLEESAPGAWHHTEQYANNRIEADHGQLKRRLRLMAGSRPTAEPRSSSPDTRSCRTSAADTTNSGSRNGSNACVHRLVQGCPSQLACSGSREDGSDGMASCSSTATTQRCCSSL